MNTLSTNLSTHAVQSLPQVLEDYRYTLQRLQTAPRATKTQVLDVLTVRDQVKATLQTLENVPSEALLLIHDLDQQLQQQTERILDTVDLTEWQGLLSPPEEDWWWFLQRPPQIRWWNQYDWLWNGITIMALTATVSVWMDTASRFFQTGITAMGTLAVLSEFVLAALTAAGTLTKTGREALYHFYRRLKVPEYYWQEMNSLLAVLLLVVVIVVHSVLPQVAVRVTQQGIRQYEAGQFNSAIARFEQAIALRPDYAEAHFYLGEVYQDLQQFDLASQEFQRVAQTPTKLDDPILWTRAINNLGLIALQQDNHDEALMRFNQGLSSLEKAQLRHDITLVAEEVTAAEYDLRVSLAQTRIDLEDYGTAIQDLDTAIALDQNQATAHCLFAQASQGKGLSADAIAAFELCQQATDAQNAEASLLLQITQERLKLPTESTTESI
jgi:tetratricopeptide (TPR) repeat protein